MAVNLENAQRFVLWKDCGLCITVKRWKEGFLNQQEAVTPDVD